MGASAADQVRALFAKSAVYQRRNTATNICLVIAPIFFCGLLLVLQIVANTLILTQRDNNCGCQCTSCCIPRRVQQPWTDEELVQLAAGVQLRPRFSVVEQCIFLDTGFCEIYFKATCRAYNDSNCGIKYSSTRQAVFCPIPEPSTWPPALQTPRIGYRAGGVTTQWLPFTGSDMTAARQVAANLPTAPELPNLQPLVDMLGEDPVALLSMPPERLLEMVLPLLAPDGLVKNGGAAVDAAQLSRLGVRFGTAVRTTTNYFLDSAFINSNSNTSRLQFLLPYGECNSAGISNVTSYTTMPLPEMILLYYNATYPVIVPALLQAFNLTPAEVTASIADSPVGSITAACVDQLPREAANLTVLNRRLYCGFGSARCDGTFFIREYGAAWDFKALGPTALNFTTFYNLTLPLDDMPLIYRISQAVNMAVMAWTKTYWERLPVVGRVRNRLLGVMEFPKLEFTLKLDFSILLGPLFYTWVIQLLMPSLLQLLVYEKEKRLRMMMKMHGLNDGVYWFVTYIWYLMLYVVYMIFFVVFGSLIGLKIFLYNSYVVQAILYFIFGNNMIAFMFLLSSLFTSSRTATVVAFLYVFAAGLIGELLLRTLMQQQKAYVIIVQLIPGFALYRGLLEFSEYSIRAILADKDGFRWSNLADPGNGMISVWVILAVEWPLFMLTAWYLEQVSPTGTGARRHPLFFIRGLWHKPSDDLSALRASTKLRDHSTGRRVVHPTGAPPPPSGLTVATDVPGSRPSSSNSSCSSPVLVPPPTITPPDRTPSMPATPAAASLPARGAAGPVAEGTEGGGQAADAFVRTASDGGSPGRGSGAPGGSRGSSRLGGGEAGPLDHPVATRSPGGPGVASGGLVRVASGAGEIAMVAAEPSLSPSGTISTQGSLHSGSLARGYSSGGGGSGGGCRSLGGGTRAYHQLGSPRSNAVMPLGTGQAPAGFDGVIAVRPNSGSNVKQSSGPLEAVARGMTAPAGHRSSSGGGGGSAAAGPAAVASGGGGAWSERSQSSSSGSAASAVVVEADDVRQEAERVAAFDDAQLSSMPIVVRDLAKVFPTGGKSSGSGGGDGGGGCGERSCAGGCGSWCCGAAGGRVAVRTLTLGIERGECFGLLGPNGAGKTTTIHMLTGFLEPTAGDALVEGRSVRTRMEEIYRMMGVCPQENLLWEQLTGEEHLQFYGRLKGLKGKELKEAVDAAIKSVKLHINDAGKRRVEAYSGGMKRRLSVGISFIGDPRVVYLDEPSTGLDPASRRALWDVVRRHKENRAIILTTHSMEEAEILCDRLGIFVDGQLVCVGNPREITSRYAGYLVFTITVAPGHEDAAQAFVQHMSPNARLTYSLSGTFKYELPTSEISLSSVFGQVASAKDQMQIIDWGVANANLEEVFIKFAKQIGAEMREQ